MSEIIRRNKKVPVQARRVEPPIETVNIPGAGPVPIPPAAPGVTQNIIYVNVPEGQASAPPPPAAAPPTEVHFHTTNIYQSPRRRRSRGTSFLATMGFVLGGVAAGAAYVPQTTWLAKPIAELGFGMATFGMLGALLFGRVGKLMPLLGLLSCAMGYGLWLKNTGQPIAIAIPKIALNLVNPSSPVVPNAPASSTPATPVPSEQKSETAPSDPTRLHDKTIFGDGMGTWSKPGSTATPPAASPPAISSPPPVAPAPVIDLTTATANLEKARDAAALRWGIDYQSAKAAAATAATQYEQAKITSALGSPELIAASQQRLAADSNLNQIEAKLRTDPAVAAAEKALNAATASSK